MDQSEQVHSVDKRKWKGDYRNCKGGPSSGKLPKQVNCRFCGRKHEEKKKKCPAWGKMCNQCGGKNHFSAVCSKQRPTPVRKKSRGCLSKSNINVVYQDEDSDQDDYCLMAESVNCVYQEESPKKIFLTMVLEDKSVKFQSDSGATVNILPVEIYKDVRKDSELKHLKNSGTTLVMFNNSELRPLGTVKLQTRNPKNDESYLPSIQWYHKGWKHTWVHNPSSNSVLCQSMLTTLCLHLLKLLKCQQPSKTSQMFLKESAS